MLYRFKTSPQWVLVIALAFPAVLWAKSEEITNHQSVTQKQALPAYDGERIRPVVAIIAENRYTELTDYVIPYGVLKQSGVADLATREGSIQFFPSSCVLNPNKPPLNSMHNFPRARMKHKKHKKHKKHNTSTKHTQAHTQAQGTSTRNKHKEQAQGRNKHKDIHLNIPQNNINQYPLHRSQSIIVRIFS